MQTWYDPFQYFNICAIIRCPFRIWLLSEVCLNPHVYLFPFRHFPFRSQGTQINHLVSSSFFFLTQLSHDIRFKFFVSALSDIRPCSECSQLMQWKRNSLFPMFFLLFFPLSLCPIELRPTVSFARVHCPRRCVSIDFYASNSANTVTPSLLTIQALVSAIRVWKCHIFLMHSIRFPAYFL